MHSFSELAERFRNYGNDYDALGAASGLQPELIRQILRNEIKNVEPAIIRQLMTGLMVPYEEAKKRIKR